MRTKRGARWAGLFLLLMSVQVWPATPTVSGDGGRVISFPQPPDPNAIGTQVGAISTYVSQVTLSPPASIHRLGFQYSEIRGTIAGVGWGGSGAGGTLLACPYRYDLPYVLRIPPGWDGGLVIYRHEFDSIDSVAPWETAFGSRNFFRVIHETEDRAASDAALHPSRRWAYFAVNTTGVSPGGAYNTTLLDAPGCIEGTPVNGTRDATLARDNALVAQYLLKVLRDREVTLTLGVGFAQGSVVNFALNTGYRYATDLTRAGDNHRTPYDPSSGLIFNGFLWIDAIPANNAGDLSQLSAPTIFLVGDAWPSQQAAINQINRLALTPGLDVRAMSRLYTIRNVNILDADWNLSLTREDVDWANAELPGMPLPLREYYLGSGERTRPLIGALLDALAAWSTQGVPPPTSQFNGQVKTAPDRIEFYRTSPPATAYPYVDDVTLDTYLQLTPTTPTAALRTAWQNVRNALGGVAGSVVLPETACRRGGFQFISGVGPTGNDFHLFDAPTFLNRWGSVAAFEACRVRTVDALVAQGLYDPTFAIVDIAPDDVSNVVDLRSPGWLPVAILSTTGFDATEIVPGSLRLAGVTQQGVARNPGNVRTQVTDVDGDGRLDLWVEFRTDRLNFGGIDIVADVWGQTQRGVPFSGSDLVQIVR